MPNNGDITTVPRKQKIGPHQAADDLALDKVEQEVASGSSRASAIRRCIEAGDVAGPNYDAIFKRLERKWVARRKTQRGTP